MAKPVSAAEVIREELEAIKERRCRTLLATAQGDDQDATHDTPAPEVGPLQNATDPATSNADTNAQLTGVRNQALDKHLVGLSFSGGGIRSGTFAVGFLQGLASLKLLRRVDYLSTVSGGGYAGGWLAAWIYREGRADDRQNGEGPVKNVELQLAPSRVSQKRSQRHLLKKNDYAVDEEPAAAPADLAAL